MIEKGKDDRRRMCWRPSASDIEFAAGPLHDRRHRPLDRHHGAGRAKLRGGLKLPATRPHRWTSQRPPSPLPAFPNGCHVAEVEIDPDTGMIEVVQLRVGQRFRHRDQSAARRRPGAWRRRAGHRTGAAGERRSTTTTASCSPARSWTTAMPRRCAELRSFASHPAPATTNPLGTKGCGEGGCAGALASLMNADRRCAVGLRHPQHRHAGDAGADLAGDPGPRNMQGGIMSEATVRLPGAVASRNATTQVSARRISSATISSCCCAAVPARARRISGQPHQLASRSPHSTTVSAVLQTPAGFLIDRVGPRVILIAGLLQVALSPSPE